MKITPTSEAQFEKTARKAGISLVMRSERRRYLGLSLNVMEAGSSEPIMKQRVVACLLSLFATVGCQSASHDTIGEAVSDDAAYGHSNPHLISAIEGLRYQADIHLEHHNAEALHDTLEKLYKLEELKDSASAAEIAQVLSENRKILSAEDYEYFRQNELSGKELEDHEVVLTFDDGPMRAYTPKIIAELQRQHLTATFFEVGTMIQSAPDLTRAVAQAGFIVANHSWDHPNFTQLSDDLVKKQISATNQQIKTALGFGFNPQIFQNFFNLNFGDVWPGRREVSGPEFFRTPFGGRSRRILELIRSYKSGRNCEPGELCTTSHLYNVMWLIDSIDYGDKDPVRIANRVFNQLHLFRNRGIILMHDIHPQTVEAFRLVAPRLAQEGFKVKSMYDALKAMEAHRLSDASTKQTSAPVPSTIQP